MSKESIVDHIDTFSFQIDTLHYKNIESRGFLSYSPTGKGIAGRIFQGLRDTYNIYFHPESSPRSHSLTQSLKKTRLFVFILMPDTLTDENSVRGTFISLSICFLHMKYNILSELRAAIRYNRKVFIIRHPEYALPNPLPDHIADLEVFILSISQLREFYPYFSSSYQNFLFFLYDSKVC
jgi:hypothetical protein